MNILAPLTLLAALISTILFFSPATAHAVSTDTSATDILPLLTTNVQQADQLPVVEIPLQRPEGQVVNDNPAFPMQTKRS